MFKLVIQLGFLAVAMQLAEAADISAASSAGMRVDMFTGWENALVLHGGDCRAVVVPTVGGRITHYSLNGENVIYEEPGSGGKTLASTPAGFDVGGYQCDLGPESRGLPPHLALWLGSYTWKTPRPSVVTLQSELDPGLGLQMEKDIVLDPDSGELGLQQRVKNVSGPETSCALWDRTRCKSGGYVFLPLTKKNHFKEGWSIRTAEGKYVSGTSKTADPRLSVIDHVLIVEAKGPALRIGSESDAGWIAYTVGRVLFVKYFPVVPKASYPDGGNCVEVFCDEKFVEFGPLSPEAKLKSGESASLPEKWTLSDLERTVLFAREVRPLVKRVPPSPFKK